MLSKKIIFAGNAITAHILYGYLASDTRYELVGCVVDDAYVEGASFTEVPSYAFSQLLNLFPPHEVRVIMAMGYDQINGVRRGMFERLKAVGYTMETYVHPSAIVLTKKPLGEGSCVMAGALIEPGASVGANCILWGNTVVAHDAIVEDHCWLAAGAVISGMARIGHSSFVGVNATISNKVEIGVSNIVGGAAFISKCTKQNTVHLARSAEMFRCTAEEYAKYFGV